MLGFVFIAKPCIAEPIRFIVKPKLCVLAAGEEICHDRLELVWSAGTEKSVCLFQSDKTLPLRCWENETKGKHAVEITTDADIEFQLREIDETTVIIAESFQVLQDKKNYRRRRRNPWNFF